MGEPRKLMLLLKTTAQERKMFLLRDSVDSVEQIKTKSVILATLSTRLTLELYHDADLHCGNVLEDEIGLSFLRNLTTILDNKRSGSVRQKNPIVQFDKTKTQSPAQLFYSLRLRLLPTIQRCLRLWQVTTSGSCWYSASHEIQHTHVVWETAQVTANLFKCDDAFLACRPRNEVCVGRYRCRYGTGSPAWETIFSKR